MYQTYQSRVLRSHSYHCHSQESICRCYLYRSANHKECFLKKQKQAILGNVCIDIYFKKKKKKRNLRSKLQVEGQLSSSDLSTHSNKKLHNALIGMHLLESLHLNWAVELQWVWSGLGVVKTYTGKLSNVFSSQPGVKDKSSISFERCSFIL